MKIAELLQALTDEQVHYVLVGGLAVQLHGFLRDRLDIEALEKIKRGEDPNA